MNTEYISELLHRFMQGETTEQEEQELANYFNTATEIPAQWSNYAALFHAFEQGQPSFTEDEKDAFTVASISQGKRMVLRWTTGIAASFLIVAGMAAWLYLKPDGQEKAVALQKPTPVETVKERPQPQVERSALPLGSSKKITEAPVLAEAKSRSCVKKAKPTPAKQPTVEHAAEPENDIAQANIFPEMLTPSPEVMYAEQTTEIRQRGEQVMHHVAVLNETMTPKMQYIDF